MKVGGPGKAPKPRTEPEAKRSPWPWVVGAVLVLAGLWALSDDAGEAFEEMDDQDEAPNPRKERLQRARRFREAFHWGYPARRTKRREISPRPDVLVDLGELEAVTYRTRKKGEKLRRFVHEFGETGRPRPRLGMDIDTKRLHIVGGGYTVTPRGIED